MRESVRRPGAALFLCLAAYFAISAVFLLLDRTGLTSDTKFYLAKSEECLRQGTFYPGRHNEHDDYVQNPGYVNYLLCLKRLGVSLKGVYFLNILLSLAMLLLLYSIAKSIFGRPLSPLPLIFILFPRSYAMNLDLYSDLLSAVMAYLCIFLFLRKRPAMAVLSGLLLAATNFVRPEAPVFVAAILVYALIARIPRLRVALFAAAFLLGVLGIGTINRARTGHFVFQSVTGGFNLLVGANPEANGKGEVYRSVFQPGKPGYVPDSSGLNYLAKDRFWRGQAVRWIARHPLKYVLLAIPKVGYSFSVDSWGINKLANTDIQRRGISKLPVGQKGLWYFFQLFNQIIYLAILVLALLSLRSVYRKREAWILILIIAAGVAFIGALVGDARMKYPVLPALLVLAAYSADAIRTRCSGKSGEPAVGLDR